jgi:hypothetical protein
MRHRIAYTGCYMQCCVDVRGREDRKDLGREAQRDRLPIRVVKTEACTWAQGEAEALPHGGHKMREGPIWGIPISLERPARHSCVLQIGTLRPKLLPDDFCRSMLRTELECSCRPQSRTTLGRRRRGTRCTGSLGRYGPEQGWLHRSC